VSPGDTDVVTGTRSPDRLSAIPVPSGPRDPGGPSPRGDDQGLTALPLAGQPGPYTMRARLAADENCLGLTT